MKKTILLLSTIVAFTAHTVKAQTINVPNGGFETWTTVAGVEKLTSGWVISDEMGINCSPLSSVKTTDTASGNYALYLQTSNCPGAGGAHEGFAFITFSLSAKPTELRLKYKSTRVADSASIDIKLIKRIAGTQTVVGQTKYKIGNSVSTYTALNIPLSYTDTTTPDTAIISIESDDISTVTIGNKLWVDNVSLWKPAATTGVKAVATGAITNASAYPVPAHSIAHVRFEIATPGDVKASLYNIHGRLLSTEIWNCTTSGAQIRTTPIDELPNGIYYFQLQHNGQTAIVKLIKE